MKRKTCAFQIIPLVFLVAVLFSPNTAKGTLITNLTETNVNLPDGTYGTVSVSASGNFAIFNVDPNDDYFKSLNSGGVLGSNFGLQTFYFNTTLDHTKLTFAFDTNHDGVYGGSGDIDWNVDYLNQNAGGGFGKFIVETSGTGSTRQNPLKFKVTYSSGTVTDDDFFVANKEGYHFAGHIADFIVDGQQNLTSAMFADGAVPAVPEPSTLLLLGSGLVGLAFLRNASKKK